MFSICSNEPILQTICICLQVNYLQVPGFKLFRGFIQSPSFLKLRTGSEILQPERQF